MNGRLLQRKIQQKLIAEIKDGIAVVDYEVEKRKGKLIDKSYKKGDCVIIQGGIVVSKVNKKEAVEALRLYKKSF